MSISAEGELRAQHERWKAARERLWKPTRRDIRSIIEALPEPAEEAEPELWGCPLNMLTKPSPRFLIKLVSLRRGLTPDEMLGRARSRSMVGARDEAVALIYTHCRKMSLPELGRLFGGRDHTTILHSLRKMRKGGKAVYRVFPTINTIHRDANKTGVATRESAIAP